MTIGEVEDTLLIRSWGRWAAERPQGEIKRPGYVKAFLAGRREDPREVLAPISDDYALELDREIAGLQDHQKRIVYGIYVGRASLASLCRVLRTTKQSVAQDRDAALWYLFGRLKDTV